MTAPVPQALATELAVWNAALVRRFATSVETRTARTLQTCFPKRQLVGVGSLVEEGDQAVVTTMAQQVEVPPRRYPWGRPESKYIESPGSSACSWPSMCTFNLPLSV